MTSLTDIPLELRDQPDKLTFIRWLAKIPLTYDHKRTLASLWAKDTAIKLTKTDWTLLQTSSLFNPNQSGTKISPST